MAEHAYRPGRMAAVVTDDGFVVLSGESPPALLQRLWQQLLDQADPQDLIEALTQAYGFRELPAFALALRGPDGVQVAVRGALSVCVQTSQSEVPVAGADVSTWAERFIGDARAVRLEPRTDDTDDLPLLGGIVFVDSLSLQVGRDRPVGVAQPAGPLATELMNTRPPNIGPNPDPNTGPPAKPPPRPSWGRLVLSTGDVVDLDGTVILGRAPSASRGADGRLPRLHEVDSPNQEISRSHLEISVGDGVLRGRDLGSSNGTVLQRPGQLPAPLPVERGEPLYPGDVLDLGEGLQVRIDPPA